MILVDSSVWVDYFRGATTAQTEKLDSLLGREPLVIGDLILAEILQGFTSDKDFKAALRLLDSLEVVDLGGREIAIKAAKNFRALRALGITVRKTIDTVIATRCIESGYTLLHCDRDFEPFVTHLGLRSAVPGISRCSRSTRQKVDSLAMYTPSSASMGTMRAGGRSAKRGSLATRSTCARSPSDRA